MKSDINSYLIFTLGKERFGTHVRHVLSIIEPGSITQIPDSPKFIKGIINLRGMILPIMDLKQKMGIGEVINDQDTCIIVHEVEINNESVKIGVLVDSVISVVEIHPNNIKEVTAYGTAIAPDYITGTIEIDNKFVMLINESVIFEKEANNIEKALNEV